MSPAITSTVLIIYLLVTSAAAAAAASAQAETAADFASVLWSTNSSTSVQQQRGSQPGAPLHKLANMTLTDFVSKLVDPRRYDNLFRPVPEDGGPTRVQVSINIDSFGPVNMINMEFAVELILLMRWTDPRLRYTGHPGVLVLSQIADAVWKPGVFFKNAKDVIRHDLPSRNYLLWLWPNGTLQYNQKLNMRFHCHMNVRDFPFDTQHCSMDIGVFEMHVGDQVLRWSDGVEARSKSIKDSSSLSQFFAPVVKFGGGDAYSAVTQKNFSYLSASFELRRKHSYYILYNYLPSTFIVLATWSSFAIDHKSPPARVSLSTVCFLAQITQSLALESKLPRVSYVTALGIWHIGCIVFVYLSLLEYMVINLLRIRKERRRKRLQALAAKRSRTTSRDAPLLLGSQQQQLQQLQQQQQQQQLLLQQDSILRETLAKLFKRKKSNWRLTPSRLDFICLFLYPALFGLFNIVYWSYCVPRRAIS